MVSTETLQVIINAKDQLTSKVKQAENAVRGLGNTATTSSNTATTVTHRLGTAYEQLRTKVTGVWNTIRNTIGNSSIGQAINSSGIARPFLNAAEQIKQRYSSMTEIIKGKLKSIMGTKTITIKGDNGDVIKKIKVTQAELEKIKRTNVDPFKNISTAGLNVLNGQLNEATIKASKFQGTTIKAGNSVKTVTTSFGSLSSMAAGVFAKLSTGWSNATNKVTGYVSKLRTVGNRMQSVVGGLSGVQSAIMSAFGVVGVTSISQFTVSAAIAREKVNAVTKSVTGSGAAFEKVNKQIKSSISGTTLGYNNMATAVNNVALRFHVTGEAVGNLASPMAKIGVLAQAMGKSSSEAASVMEHAYDGLLGRWRALKQYGITEDDLKAAGWSGAANDVDGYTRALDKVLERNPKLKEFTSTFEYQFQSLKMSIQAVGTEIGLMLLPILKGIVEFFLDLNKQAPWLTKALIILAIAVMGLVSVLSVLAPIILMIVELQTAELAISLATVGVYLAVIAVIVAVIAIMWYLYNTNDSVRAVIDKLANTIRGTLIKAWDNLNKIVQPLIPTFNHFLAVLGRLAKDILGLFGITGQAAEEFDWMGLVMQAISLVIQDIINRITLLVQLIAAILIPVINLIINVVSIVITLLVSVAEAFSLLMQGDIVGFLTTLGGALWTFFTQLLTVFGQFFLELFNNLNLIFNNILLTTWTWLTQWITNMALGAWQAVTGFIYWITTLPAQLVLWLLQAYNNFVQWRDNLVAKFKEAAMTAVTNFINWIKTLPAKFKEWLDNTANRVREFAKTLYDRMKSAAQDAVNGFKEKIGNLPDAMWNALVGIKNKIAAGVGMLVEAMRNLAWSMWNSFVNIFTGNNTAYVPLDEALTRIHDNISSSSDSFYNAGVLLGEAVSAGISDVDIGATGIPHKNITATGNYSYGVTHSIKNNTNNNLLSQVVELLGMLVDQGEDDRTIHAELEQRGTVTLAHDVNLQGVPEGIDEASIIDTVKQVINTDDVIKALTSNREFQRMDTRMKQKIIREYERHI